MVGRSLIKSVLGEIIARSPVIEDSDIDDDVLVDKVVTLSNQYLENREGLQTIRRSRLLKITKLAVSRVGIPCVDVDFSLATELSESETIPNRAEQYLPWVANRLDLPEESRSKVKELINSIDSPTRSPKTLLAAMMYIAGLLLHHRRSQFEIARLCGVSEVSLRNGYQEYVDELDLNVNPRH